MDNQYLPLGQFGCHLVVGATLDGVKIIHAALGFLEFPLIFQAHMESNGKEHYTSLNACHQLSQAIYIGYMTSFAAMETAATPEGVSTAGPCAGHCRLGEISKRVADDADS